MKSTHNRLGVILLILALFFAISPAQSFEINDAESILKATTDHLIVSMDRSSGELTIQQVDAPESAVNLSMAAGDDSPIHSISEIKEAAVADDRVEYALNLGDAGSAVVVIHPDAIELRPEKSIKLVRIEHPFRAIVQPSFYYDDYILKSWKENSRSKPFGLTTESFLIGLAGDENRMVNVFWEEDGIKSARARQSGEAGEPFTAIELEPGGKTIFLSVSQHPDIWHREPMKPEYLEKTTTLNWRNPFQAKRWRVQMPVPQESPMGSLDTSMEFRPISKKNNNAIVPGPYQYPVWFNSKKDDAPVITLSKSIPPRDEVIIYPLGPGDNAPVPLPLELISRHLGEEKMNELLFIEREEGAPIEAIARLGGVEAHPDIVGKPHADGTYSCRSYPLVGLKFSSERYVKEADLIKAQCRDWSGTHAWCRHFMSYLNPRVELLQQYVNELKTESGTETLAASIQEILDDYWRRVEENREIITAEYADERLDIVRGLTEQKNDEALPIYRQYGKQLFDVGVVQIDVILRPQYRLLRKVAQIAGDYIKEHPEAADAGEGIRERTRFAMEVQIDPI